MDSERWRTFKRVCNDSRYVAKADGSIVGPTGKTIGDRYSTNGRYRCFYVKSGGKSITLSVARFICAKFHGLPDVQKEVNHKNGNKLDNRAHNLEWVTSADNLKHKYRELKCPAVIGNNKINFDTAEGIRRKKLEGSTLIQLGNEYGLSKSSISYIINNRTWKPNIHKNTDIFTQIEACLDNASVNNCIDAGVYRELKSLIGRVVK